MKAKINILRMGWVVLFISICYFQEQVDFKIKDPTIEYAKYAASISFINGYMQGRTDGRYHEYVDTVGFEMARRQDSTNSDYILTNQP